MKFEDAIKESIRQYMESTDGLPMENYKKSSTKRPRYTKTYLEESLQEREINEEESTS